MLSEMLRKQAWREKHVHKTDRTGNSGPIDRILDQRSHFELRLMCPKKSMVVRQIGPATGGNGSAGSFLDQRAILNLD